MGHTNMKYIVGLLACAIFCLPSFSAPPTVEFPKETKAIGDYVIITPKTDAKTVSYIKGTYNNNTLDGVEPFPSAMLKDAKVFMLPVRGLAKGRYTFTGVASLNDEHTVFPFEIIVGESVGPIPPIPPKPIPPEPDSTTYESPVKLYIVEETAQRTTAITKLLLDLEFWNDLEKQGYIMRPYDITSTDAKRMGLDKIKQPTPFIVVVSKDGSVIGSYPLPLTREGVKVILPKLKLKIGANDQFQVDPVIPYQPQLQVAPYYHPLTTSYCPPGTVCPSTAFPPTKRIFR